MAHLDYRDRRLGVGTPPAKANCTPSEPDEAQP